MKIYQNPGGGDGVRTSMVMIKRDAAVTANGIKLVGRKLELPARLPQRAYERKIRKGYAVGLTAGFQHPPVKRGVVRDKMRNALQKRRHLRPKFQKHYSTRKTRATRTRESP